LRAAYGDFSRTSHFFDSPERLQGTEENRPGCSFQLAGYVQAIVISINEVDISVTGRAEQDSVAQGAACGGVGGSIVGAEINFDLDNATGVLRGLGVADQDLAQELAAYIAGIACEEGAREWLEGIGLSTRHIRTSHPETRSARLGDRTL
jgi:hypothetical protein